MIALILVIGLAASFYLSRGNDNIYDLPLVFFYQNGLSTYFQMAIYFIVFIQVVRFRSIRNLVAIRQQTEEIVVKLLKMVVVEWAVFWLGVLGPYILLHKKLLFKLGNALLGSGILGMHMIMMLLLMIIIVAAYKIPHPYLILFLVIVINFAYHQYIDLGIMLPKYSQIFDPIYRAIHHIYF